ncbi:MAG: GW dipeptide domain-containing protein [Bacteroidia bacterium]
MRFFSYLFIAVSIAVFLQGCSSSPKEIQPSNSENSSEGYNTNVFSEGTKTEGESAVATAEDEEIHTVKVLEVMPTQRYSYLRVSESSDEYWLATIKGDFSVGETYHYTGGLLKQNFKSVEHNRVFDKLYLVSNIVSSNHANEEKTETVEWNEETNTVEKVDVEGSMKISEIVAKAEELNGKTIQVSGKVTKVNPNIMGVNWIHLNDGTNDGFDMVLTTDANIPVGHTVTFMALVTTNKDFGAGYKYDLILEKGELIQ